MFVIKSNCSNRDWRNDRIANVCRCYVWITMDGSYTHAHTRIYTIQYSSVVYKYISSMHLSLFHFDSMLSLLARAWRPMFIRFGNQHCSFSCGFSRTYLFFSVCSLSKIERINRRLCCFNWWHRYESDRCLLNSRTYTYISYFLSIFFADVHFFYSLILFTFDCCSNAMLPLTYVVS